MEDNKMLRLRGGRVGGGSGTSLIGIDMVNIQGLTEVKAVDIMRRMGDDKEANEVRIIGMVETHEKFKRIEWGEDVKVVNRMREMNDKKGGGILILTSDVGEIEMEKIDCDCRDLLAVEVRVGGFSFWMVLVYLDTREEDRNRGIYGNLDGILGRIPEDKALVVLGDFNGHVGFLGEQELNRNGVLMLDFMQKWNLVMLNVDERCRGKYTRVQGNERSVIDYYLVNELMYRRFEGLVIDDEKEMFDLSDHCYMAGAFRVKEERLKRKECEWEEKSYYKVDDERMMSEFVSRMEEEIDEAGNMDVDDWERIVREKAEECLKVTVRRKIGKISKKVVDQPWMNDRIRREIKYRKFLNRRKRRLEGEERERVWSLYREQKEKVKRLVREVKMEFERKITEEVRRNKNGKKKWKMIKKLQGREVQERRGRMYGEYGEEIDEELEGEVMMSKWKEIYQKNENKVVEVWNEERRDQYERDRENGIRELEMRRIEREETNIPGVVRLRVGTGVEEWMKDVRFVEEDVKRRLKRVKSGKQPGPDGIKGELYKAMGGSEKCIRGIARVYNGVLERGIVREEWRKSKTVMIPKVKKPQAMQHRPVALTNAGYKIFMGMVKDRLVEQEVYDGRVSDMQAGFTEGRRLEENLWILGNCVEESYARREVLVVVAVDFRKAFDSIDRGELIESMIYYKCDPRVIQVIAELYRGDVTEVWREGRELGRIEVKNGIRQGCTGSPRLFVMVVSKIIERLIQSGLGYRSGHIRVPVLFYADDGLMLARSRREAEEMIGVLEESARECGLAINTEKSKCMVFNGGEEGGNEIRGMEVVKEVRYLGVLVSARRDCFRENKKEKIMSAERMVNVTYSVVERSCDRLLIGKTFWKSVVLPGVLHAGEVMVWNRTEMEKMQRIENGVWRRVMRAPTYTPVAGLQGEVGCSSMKARDMKGKMKFGRFLMNTRNGMLRGLVRRAREGGNSWMRRMSEYMEELELSWETLKDMEDREIVGVVDRWEERRWRREIESMSSLVWYRGKEKIGGEHYENRWGACLLFRVRTNTLRLGWRARFWGGEVECGMCGEGEETLEHFLMECPGLEEVRGRYGVGSVDEVMRFGERNLGDVWSFLEEAWSLRGELVGGRDRRARR